MKTKMKHSIRKKLIILLLCIIAGNFFVFFSLNRFFLEKYYLHTKEKSILKGYEELNEILRKNDSITQDDTNKVAKVCEKYNITIIVIDSSDYIEIQYGNGWILQQRLREINFGISNAKIEVIEKKDNYILQKYKAFDDQGEYMELTGFFNQNRIFLMRIAVESIQESVNISLKFFVYVGIIVLIIAGIIAFFMANRFVKPILKLSELSKEMSNLNFNVKSDIKSNDELGVLGDSMNELSEKLEKTIVELKQANTELKKDIAKKEEVDNMRKEFISNVSHELKTPIALIQGYAEGLQESVIDDEESRKFYCEVIVDEADKMNKLVKNLLSLNQLESGYLSVKYEKFDVSEVINSVVLKLDYLLKQKEVEVIKQYDNCFAYADEFMIEQVITNYLTNAINHVDDNKIIKIIAEKMENKVKIIVYNSGNNIQEESIGLIWDKFYKVDKARTREYGGNGIGLSIVKAILDAHNSEFGVGNKENGVEFWFVLDTELC